MLYDFPSLLSKLDTLYPSTGSLGYVALLDGDLGSVAYTVDTSTDVLTTATDHGWVTGTRVRATSSGSQPIASPSLNRVLYVNVQDSVTLTLHQDLTTAIAAISPVNFGNTGSGTLTLTEQSLLVSDPLEVLVSHELSHPDYTRQEILNTGAAEIDGSYTKASKNGPGWTVDVGSSNPDFTFAHVLLISGGSSTIGDTTGTKDALYTLDTPALITPGNAQFIALKLTLGNAA